MFKICPKCNTPWETIESFLAAPDIQLKGYQPNADDVTLGFFLFNHKKISCDTTLSIQARDFQNLLTKPLTIKSFLIQNKNCLGFCKHENVFEACPNSDCSGYEVRHLLTLIHQKLLHLSKKGYR